MLDLASRAPTLRLGLLTPRVSPLRRVDDRHGHQRRGAHHHPVRLGPATPLRLEGHGVVCRIQHLAHQQSYPGPVNLVETASGRLWHGYRVSALDDTKVHRSRAHVWGTCTFHEYTSCCPNRATTDRAHNWVVLGVLLHVRRSPPSFCPSPVGSTSASRSCAAAPGARVH